MRIITNTVMTYLVKSIMPLIIESIFPYIIMTKKEMADIAQRLMVAKLLSEQTVYNKIVEQTGASTATISRVNRAYNYGSGGYAKMLEKLKGEE